MSAQFPSQPSQPRNVNQALRLARVAERAAGMFTPCSEGGKGYTAYQNNGGPVWSVISPEHKSYAVTLGAQPSCSCPDFADHGDYCKHTFGLQLQLEHEAEAEQCARLEALYSGCELETTGCDPFAEF